MEWWLHELRGSCVMSEFNRFDFKTSLDPAYEAKDYIDMGKYRPRWLFAIRYFDFDLKELGYWIPGVSDTSGGVRFHQPRTWSESYLDSLTWLDPKPQRYDPLYDGAIYEEDIA